MRLASEPAAYSGGLSPDGHFRRTFLSDAVVFTSVLMVSVVETALFDPFAESDPGLNEQDEYCGRPEQLRLTVPLKPPTGVSVIVVVPD